MRGVRDAPIMLGVVQPWSPGERLLITFEIRLRRIWIQEAFVMVVLMQSAHDSLESNQEPIIYRC